MPSGVFSLKQQAQARSEGAWPGSPPTTLNYLVVAGGGGAGRTGTGSGGGGGGGLLQGSLVITPGTSYTVTVGSGGAGSTSASAAGTSGGNSVLGSLTAIGGGGGASGGTGGTYANATTGGSGGGGTASGYLATFVIPTQAQGTAGQGNSGAIGASGNGSTLGYGNYGGGGGGAGTPGLPGINSQTGNGGAGIASDISGVRTAYAGGGAGGTNNGNPGTGGVGGGGSTGASNDTVGQSGGANTGGGGGGGNAFGSNQNGGSGGSGIVIVSYPGTTQWFTGGTLSYANGNVIHTFYTSGTLAPTAPSNFVNTDYQISRSLRFNAVDGTSLDRTPASATNRQTFTLSFWAKNASTAGSITTFYAAGSDTNNNETIIGYWDGLYVQNNAASVQWRIRTNAVYRDPSAWYHFVFAFDLSNPVQANRLKIYVNGVETSYAGADGNPLPSTANSMINSNVVQYIGRRHYSSTGQSTNAYMTEVNFIDGQALTPSAFGYVNPNTGVWSPLKFVGTYGTNGFYLNFSDNSNTTATTLGKDYSGNGNNWTPNNFSVTAGAGNDSLVDSPTVYGTDTGTGGEVRGNYCTLNAVDAFSGTLSNGNLEWTGIYGTQNGHAVRSTLKLPPSGKWYVEATNTTAAGSGNGCMLGFSSSTQPISTSAFAANATPWIGVNASAFDNNIRFYSYGVSGSLANATSIFPTYPSGDIVNFAIDFDSGKFWVGKNGTWYNSGNPAAGTNATSTFTVGSDQWAFWAEYVASSDDTNRSRATVNFGQRPFAYTAPSGFKALVNQNLPTPTIGATSTTQAGDYFNTVLWTGDGASSRNITGVGFSPDFVWIKNRVSGTRYHVLNDIVRGANKQLYSNVTNAEETDSANLTAFGSDGFTIGNNANVNTNNNTYVAWNWKANGAGVTNTAGSITSTVSANTTSGFSIVTYTGNGSSGATVGHGLGVAPRMIIVKSRSGSTASFFWAVWHKSIYDIANGNYLILNSTAAAADNNGVWTTTGPTSTVFSIGGDTSTNNNTSTYVAYCFAQIAGYSAFGSYTGNGSADGPFIYTGFRPRYILIKRSNSSGTNWNIYDTTRSPFNVTDDMLFADLADAELANETSLALDIVSNGFKLRTTGSSVNNNNLTYIYAAFAESPFKYALAR